MRRFPDMVLAVQGHVNFGPSEAKAKALSNRRAHMVCHKLGGMGVAQHRLQPQGFGHARPRFPRGHASAGKNRRVEFRILQLGDSR